jgi:hypothetical protein
LCLLQSRFVAILLYKKNIKRGHRIYTTKKQDVAHGSVNKMQKRPEDTYSEKLVTGRRSNPRGGQRNSHATPRQVQSHKSRDTARGSCISGLYI